LRLTDRRAVFGNGDWNSLGVTEYRHLSLFVTGVAVCKGPVDIGCALVELRRSDNVLPPDISLTERRQFDQRAMAAERQPQ
jgi:hypothetical protein